MALLHLARAQEAIEALEQRKRPTESMHACTPKKTRRYPTKKKTTTKQGKTNYQRNYMKDYRQFRNWQFEETKKALEHGKPDLAKRIMNAKPSDVMYGKAKLPNVHRLVFAGLKRRKKQKSK